MSKDKNEALETLHAILKPSDTVYCILRHVSRSGMFRRISFFVIRENKPYMIDHLIAAVTHYKRDRTEEGLRVSGCGMDMGFDVVYNLGSVMFPDGFDTPPGYYRNKPMSHETNGGYAFKHDWL